MALIPTLRMLAADEESLQARAEELAHALRGGGLDEADIAPVDGAVGGGTFPEVRLPSWAVRVPSDRPDAAAEALRKGRPPVIVRVEDDRVVLDVRTVPAGEVEALVRVVLETIGPGAPQA